MEDIYMKGFLGRREWCTEPMNHQSYFQHFSHVLKPVRESKMSDVEIMQQLVPQSNQLSKQELDGIIKDTQDSHLLLLFECSEDSPVATTDEHKKAKNETIVKSHTLIKNDRKKRDCRAMKNRFCEEKPIVRKEILLNAAQKCGSKNLMAMSDYLVSFRVQEPFVHNSGDNLRPGRCMQQISVLGTQTLNLLRDRIMCESDVQDTRGEISQTPDAPSSIKSKALYPSSMFYIGNTFYVDKRNQNFLDYSTVIQNWGHGRNIDFGKTRAMEETKISSLKLRFGYPYLFMHQGCCEHLIIINDARLLSPKDTLYSMDYPLMEKVTHCNMIFCMICGRYPARWIVQDNDRLAHDPSFMCKTCFRQLNYINGKKIGNFKAYPYWQKSNLL